MESGEFVSQAEFDKLIAAYVTAKDADIEAAVALEDAVEAHREQAAETGEALTLEGKLEALESLAALRVALVKVNEGRDMRGAARDSNPKSRTMRANHGRGFVGGKLIDTLTRAVEDIDGPEVVLLDGTNYKKWQAGEDCADVFGVAVAGDTPGRKIRLSHSPNPRDVPAALVRVEDA